MRFIKRLRRSIDTSTTLSSAEYIQACNFWLRLIQAKIFPMERKVLHQKKAISSKNSLPCLSPFLDEDELIRVGGRLSNTSLPFEVKHPIVLSAHPLVKLIVRQAHLRALHAGTQLTLATLRQEFWVLHARSIVKSIIHNCVICTKTKAVSPTQLMGDLPVQRVTPSIRAFLHCGIDYAGPVLIRATAGREITAKKAYIAIFVCMATRAVHLELVDGYSTSAFLGAFNRFCSRRGLPSVMYSDNGTTFVEDDRELTAAFCSALSDPNFQNRTISDYISWHFIPPSAPHFGGLWEAGVRSVKHHIRRVVGSHKLIFEEFYTLLCEIEACLNSRPIAPLTDALDDYEPLTPGHFLIGSAISTKPEPSLLNIKENRLSRWQIVHRLKEQFWKVWQQDYIHTLQQRLKWQQASPNLVKVGQLVLVRNPLLPPCQWDLGRISQCHAGTDGLTRVVAIKTAKSKYKRSLNGICLLPVDINPAPASQSPASKA